MKSVIATRALARTEGLQPTGASTTLATFAQWGNPFGQSLSEGVAYPGRRTGDECRGHGRDCMPWSRAGRAVTRTRYRQMLTPVR